MILSKEKPELQITPHCSHSSVSLFHQGFDSNTLYLTIMLYSAPDTPELALSDTVLGDGLKVKDG